MKKIRPLLLLAIIIAAILRLWKIGSLPFPPDGDEIAFGYYGWSLLHFGTDEYGRILPLTFPSIGDFKYPGLAYLNILPALFFGLSELTSRFWSSFSGVLVVPLMYIFVKLLFKNEKAAILSAFAIAISPWSIAESRLGFENHVALVLTLAGFVLFFLGIFKETKLKSKRILIAAFIIFSFSTLTYAAQRIFIPLMLLGILAMSFIKESPFVKSRKVLAAFFLGIVAIGLAFSLSPMHRGRAIEDVWKGPDSSQRDRMQELYVSAGLSPTRVHPRITWFFHNKYTYSVIDLAKRYTDHFSPSFLFFQGEPSAEKIPDMGVLLFADILLIPLGLIALSRKYINQKGALVLLWLIVSPVPSAITHGGAHMHRASLAIVPLSILSALGINTLLEFGKNKINLLSKGFILITLALSLGYFLNQYFVQKPTDRPWYKQQVNAQMANKVLALADKYESVGIADNDYIYFLFYGKVSPQEFLNNAEIKPLGLSNPWERVKRFKKIEFLMPYECPKSGKLNVLYVCGGGNVPQNSKIVDAIHYLDGVPAYSLIEFYPLSQLPKELPDLPSRFQYMVDVEKNPQFPDGIIPKDFPGLW